MNAAGHVANVEQLKSLLEQEVEAGRLTLPVMPDVAARVKTEAANPSSSAKKLGLIIGTDPALAARVLKMANSAIYAGLSEIKDLDHAIGRLGAAMVVALVIGAAGKETFRSDDPHFNQLLSGAWKRGLCASASSRLLARRLGFEPEESFLAGLMHAAGEPVLLETIRSLISTGSIERPDDDELAQVLGELGPLAGARLLEKWGLPESLSKAVAFQANPGDAPANFVIGAWQLSLAAAFARKWSDQNSTRILSEHPAAVALGIDEDQVMALYSQTEEDVLEFATVL